MRATVLILSLLACSLAYAEELAVAAGTGAEPEAEQKSPVNWRELVGQAPQISLPQKKVKKAPQPAVKKGASYLLTYEADDGEWYETEAVATGRYAKYCNGVRYEVDAGDFTYFAKPKELRRIY